MASIDRNSPEYKALFSSESASLMKAAKGGPISQNMLSHFAKTASHLTQAERQRVLQSNRYTAMMAKEISALQVNAQLLRQNNKDLKAATAANKAYNNIGNMRAALKAANVGMRKGMSNAYFSAMGNMNQVEGGKPPSIILEQILKENKQSTKTLNSITRGGRSGYARTMLGYVPGMHGGMGGMAAGALTKNPYVAAITAAIAAPFVITKIGLDIQKSLLQKYQPYGDYLNQTAQVSRYGGGGKAFDFAAASANKGSLGSAMGALKNIFPQYKSPQQFMAALSATGIPINNMNQGANVLSSMTNLMQGKIMGGLSAGQTGGMLSQLMGLGIANRTGGTMLGTQGAAATKSVYESAFVTAMAKGYDKSKVAMAIANSVESMAAQGGAVQARLPGGVYSMFANQRSMLPGLANPTNVQNTIGGLSNLGTNILSNPAIMMGEVGYINKHGKGADLKARTFNWAKGLKDQHLYKFLKANKKEPIGLVLAAASQMQFFRDYMPAFINEAMPGTSPLMRAETLASVSGMSMADAYATITGTKGGTQKIKGGHAVTATPTGLSATAVMNKGMKSSSVQQYYKMLKNNPAGAPAYYAKMMAKGKNGKYLHPEFAAAMGSGGAAFFNPNIASAGGKNAYHIHHASIVGMYSEDVTANLNDSAQRTVSMLAIAQGNAGKKANVNEANQIISKMATATAQTTAGQVVPEDLNAYLTAQAQTQAQLLKVAQNWLVITEKLDGDVDAFNTSIQNLITKLKYF